MKKFFFVSSDIASNLFFFVNELSLVYGEFRFVFIFYDYRFHIFLPSFYNKTTYIHFYDDFFYCILCINFTLKVIRNRFSLFFLSFSAQINFILSLPRFFSLLFRQKFFYLFTFFTFAVVFLN